jgi:predicted helicase
MAKPVSITPASKPIKAYYAALRDLSDQEVSHEQAVRSAFQTLLGELARPLKWTAIPELGKKIRGKRIIPDGTLRDKYQLPRAYWEAKDTADDLDAEIKDKARKGYPLDNTIFWTPTRAVLFQNGRQKFDEPIDEQNGRPGAFCDILTAFLTYTDQPLVNFDEAVSEFTDRVPEVGKKLAQIIAEAHTSNRKFKDAFGAFFALCQTTLNPNISRQAVDEMLVQHLLTVRLFRSIFQNPEFLSKNVIAAEVEKVITALTSRAFSRDEFLSSLDRFYVAIENAAARVPDWSSKQTFLNTIYERFFQGYCVKTADTHGIVYTPQPIVDFMCASVEWVMETEFGKKLGDDGVNILDPCTGTGNFVVNLMRRAADAPGGKKRLERMYRQQLFANEIMLMPYYIAALNIEHEFFEHAGEYEAFDGLCFVDTLDLAEVKQMGMFTEGNLVRVERQKNAPITVVIGNPPYNAGQVNENDNNKNRKYNIIDKFVKRDYSTGSSATLVRKLYDPYVRFMRWASWRLGERPGVVCMVTNNSFAQKSSFDAMRAHLRKEFDTIYHVDLRGDVKADPKRSGTQFNVFGIQVGVGITVAVRGGKQSHKSCRTCSVDSRLTREQKYGWLISRGDISKIKWGKTPSQIKSPWIAQGGDKAFDALVPLVTKKAKSERSLNSRSILSQYSNGVSTNRDQQVHGFGEEDLSSRAASLVRDYNGEIDRIRREGVPKDIDKSVEYDGLKWSRNLKRQLVSGHEASFKRSKIIPTLYRPFTKLNLFYDEVLVDQPALFRTSMQFPSEPSRRIAMGFPSIGNRASWSVLVSSIHPNLNLTSYDAFQWALLEYVGEDGKSHENVTNWALGLFQSQYQRDNSSAAKRISKRTVFFYAYAILHHAGYREAFAANLRLELPRIPLAKTIDDFNAFAKAGEKLAALHLHYDDEAVVAPYRLKETWSKEVGKSKRKNYRVEDKMRLNKDKTSLEVNGTLTLEGIPPEVYRYRLGNRSALEWVIDQYQVSTDKRTGIVSDCNAWGEERDDEEYIVRLVKQVVTVSLETMKIVDSLPPDFGGPPKAE